MLNFHSVWKTLHLYLADATDRTINQSTNTTEQVIVLLLTIVRSFQEATNDIRTYSTHFSRDAPVVLTEVV